jgi:hypothetical protein
LAAGSPGSERVISVQALVLPRPEDGLTPTLSAKDAVEAAKQLRPTYVIWTEPGLLVAARVPGHAALGSHLAYVITGSSPEDAPEVLLIDAHTGELIRSGPANPSCGFRHRGGACGDPSHGHAARASGDAALPRAPSARSRATRDAVNAEVAAATLEITSVNEVVMSLSGEMPPTIRGTVYAWRTPDWWSDTRFLTNPSACLREPEEFTQQEARMELWDTTGATLYNTVYTDANGEYSLVCPGAGTFLVRATLGGLNWDVVHFADQVNGCATTPAGEPEPVHQELASVSSGSTGVDFTFGSSSGSAQEIADTNVHEWVRYCMSYWRSVVPGNSPLNDYFLVWSNNDDANAYFTASGWPSGNQGQNWSCDDAIIFGDANAASPVHFGQGTIVAHEFGHLVSHRLALVTYQPPPNSHMREYPAFSEGYSDATAAVLLPDDVGSVPPTIIGPDLVGDACGEHLREPLFCDPQFPMCLQLCTQTLPSHCLGSPGYSQIWYQNALLLGALWMDTRADLGFTPTRSLFADWTFLAVAPGIETVSCDCGFPPNQCNPPPCAPDESADSNTLHEVLVADDDDDDLTNGTPNDQVLCAIYANRNIFLEIDLPVCEERVGGSSGYTIHASDDEPTHILMRYLTVFQAGHSAADVNGDGKVDVRDLEAFIFHLQNWNDGGKP